MLTQTTINGTDIRRGGNFNLPQARRLFLTTYPMSRDCDCRYCRMPLWKRLMRRFGGDWRKL